MLRYAVLCCGVELEEMRLSGPGGQKCEVVLRFCDTVFPRPCQLQLWAKQSHGRYVNR